MHLKESEASGKISGLEKKIQYAEIEKVIEQYLYAPGKHNHAPFSVFSFHKLFFASEWPIKCHFASGLIMLPMSC